jgi:DNA-binding NtrC family response regulator
MHYDFPGNVRELRNLMERAAILAPSSVTLVTPDLLPPRIAEITVQRQISSLQPGGGASQNALDDRGLPRGLTVTFEPGRDTLENLERRLLEEALRMAGGKKGKAAELLGISRFALLRRVEKYGL